MRTGTVHRVTGETDVRVTLGLDGHGSCQVATGDTHIDDHHANEDVGIALAQEELGYGITGIAFSA
jgi:imidazoleglycerol-phosphate dehydratase